MDGPSHAHATRVRPRRVPCFLIPAQILCQPLWAHRVAERGLIFKHFYICGNSCVFYKLHLDASGSIQHFYKRRRIVFYFSFPLRAGGYLFIGPFLIESEAVWGFHLNLFLASLYQVHSASGSAARTWPRRLFCFFNPFQIPLFFINITSLVFLFSVTEPTSGHRESGRAPARCVSQAGGAAGRPWPVC